MSVLYCYGITGEKVDVNIIGFAGHCISFVSFKGIYAVVSEVDEIAFSQRSIDKNIQDMTWLTQNATVHERVVTKIMQNTTILPMKFCTIFTDMEHVELMLEQKYADSMYFLDYTQGKTEMNLKVYSQISKLKQKVRGSSPEIQQLETEMVHKSPGQSYFIQQKIDLLLKNALHELVIQEKGQIIEEVRLIVVEMKKNDIIPKKITHRDMALNVALLVDTKKVHELDTLVKDMSVRFPLCDFELSGPFATYNFIH